jgi:predicted PurR-regulated permease PerM
MPQTINIQITVKSILLLLAVGAAIWLLVAFDKIMLILFLAILLAIAIDPLVDRLESYRIPRALAILLVYIVLISILTGVVSLLVPVLVEEVSQLSSNLPNIARQVLNLPTTLIAPHFPSLAKQLSSSNLTDQLSGELGAVVGGVGGILVGFGRTFTTLVISTFLILVVGFFLTADARFAPRVIARFFPPRSRPTASTLAREMGRRLGHWARAQALVGLFFGVTFGLGLAILGVPYALSLGVAGAVLELIPYVGGVIVTALGVLVALAVSPLLALGVIVLYLIVANIESHVVYPKLVGDIVGLHPLVIIIALFVGAEVKGVLGALLAVPVTVVIQVLFDHFYRFDDPDAVEVPAPETPTQAAQPTEPAANAPATPSRL